MQQFVGQVVGIRSGDVFTDGKPRVELRLEGCSGVNRTLEFVPSEGEEFPLDQRCVVMISPVTIIGKPRSAE